MFYKAWPIAAGDKFATVVTYDRATRIDPDSAAGRLADAVGGRWHRASQSYRLSPAQARDFEAFAAAGLRGNPPYMDQRIYDPASDRSMSRKDAAAMLAQPKRCTRTPDLFGEIAA